VYPRPRNRDTILRVMFSKYAYSLSKEPTIPLKNVLFSAEIIQELMTHAKYLHVTIEEDIYGYLFYHKGMWIVEVWIDGDPAGVGHNGSIQTLYKRVREAYGYI